MTSVEDVYDGYDADEERLRSGLRGLAEVLLTEQGVEALLANVTVLAADTVPGCEAASVSLLRDGRPLTPVCSADLAREVDQSQYDAMEGPCLASIAVGEVVRVDSFAHDGRWPRFGAMALESGVTSSLSLPLHTGGEPVGALNLYSRQPDNFVGVESRAEVFARQASVTIANAQALERTQHLARHLAVALENRDVIGQAKGILMATEGVTSDEAFQVLRRASQRSNQKLHEVAREIVARRRERSEAP